MKQKNYELIKWVWEKRLSTTFNVDVAISLIEEVNQDVIFSEEQKNDFRKMWDILQDDFNKKNVGKTFICLQCRSVFMAGAMFARCCGKEVGKDLEEFSPEQHGELLVGLSNAWIHIQEYKKLHKWEETDVYKEVWQEHVNSGSYGASSIFISFIDELIRRCSEEQ